MIVNPSNGVGQTGKPQAKNETGPLFNTKKINSKWIIDLDETHKHENFKKRK